MTGNRFHGLNQAGVTQTQYACGRTGFSIRCIGRTDDMMIISGVNVYPSAIRDVVSSLAPLVTGEILIIVDAPCPQSNLP